MDRQAQAAVSEDVNHGIDGEAGEDDAPAFDRVLVDLIEMVEQDEGEDRAGDADNANQGLMPAASAPVR